MDFKRLRFELLNLNPNFQYDSDDYYYIPGLYREQDDGYLTPVFFRPEVLIKFQNHPLYQVYFCSKTYGDFSKGDEYGGPFGINRSGNIIMWLGDIARMPAIEQSYLLSENIPSDHDVGCEFYDAQIECRFTELSPEREMMKVRGEYIQAFDKKFKAKYEHLTKEVLSCVNCLNPPVTFSVKEMVYSFKALNGINVEAINSNSLASLMKSRKLKYVGLGSLKRLEQLLDAEFPSSKISDLITPLFVLYDLRVNYLHMVSEADSIKEMDFARERLGLKCSADYRQIYSTLIISITEMYKSLLLLFIA